jgi:hypothetical protein
MGSLAAGRVRSSAVGHRCAHVFSVVAAIACPSARCTVTTSEPAAEGDVRPSHRRGRISGGRGRRAAGDAELGVGHHHLDFVGQAQGRPFSVQVVMSVVQPVEARFTAPIHDLSIDIAKGPIGQTFSMEIANATEAELVVRLRAHSVPAGWKMLFSGEHAQVSLEPWGVGRVEVVAELMSDTGLREALVPFTVEVVGGGGRPTSADRVFATCYVRIQPKDSLDELTSDNEALRRAVPPSDTRWCEQARPRARELCRSPRCR